MIEVYAGSISDKVLVSKAIELLGKFKLPYKFYVASAHRTPEFVIEMAKTAKDRNVKVIIAFAGMSAHLAGVIASHTSIPVIGVPISSDKFDGMDALLSTVQMPTGVPVATVAIDGAENAALLAIQILAVNDTKLYGKLVAYRKEQEKICLSHND